LNLVTSQVKEGKAMPKMKTHRGAAKRFRKTGSGKLQRNHAFHSHILTKKGPGRKAALAAEVEVSKANSKTVKKMIPYL
jgi:large subunit ribosomal protein L35